MRLKEIFRDSLYESGHLWAPSFDDLFINEEDLRQIARLALRLINKYSYRRSIIQLDFTSGAAQLPTDLQNIHGAELLYGPGAVMFTRGSSTLTTCHVPAGSHPVVIYSDWVISKVMDTSVTPPVPLMSDQPRTKNYLEQNDLPTQPGFVYEIKDWESSCSYEDHQAIMSAYFMIAIGRSRASFSLNDSIADNFGQDLISAGTELLNDTRETLIENSYQHLGMLAPPAVR